MSFRFFSRFKKLLGLEPYQWPQGEPLVANNVRWGTRTPDGQIVGAPNVGFTVGGFSSEANPDFAESQAVRSVRDGLVGTITGRRLQYLVSYPVEGWTKHEWREAGELEPRS